MIACFSNSLNAQSDAQKICKSQASKIKETLDSDNPLSRLLQEGREGNGLRYEWMDQMSIYGIKQVSSRIRFELADKTILFRIENLRFSDRYYEFNSKTFDKEIVEKISNSNFKDNITFALLKKALDFLEKQKLKPNTCGFLYINLLDNPCLPVLDEIPTIEYDCKTKK